MADELGVHALAVSEVARLLETDATRGLTSDEAQRRLERVGPNEPAERRRPSLLASTLATVTEPFVLLLVAAGIGAILLGEVRDGVLVLVGLTPIVGAEVVTRFRSDRALNVLRQATAPVARVRRDGRIVDLPATELVPGDLVLLRVGEIVPADLRVVESAGLMVDRSLLTGEALPVAATRRPDPVDAPLIDRAAVAYAGTSVVGGHGMGVVATTGRATELGRIAAGLTEEERRRSPTQRELDRIVRILLVAAVGLISLTVGAGFLRGQPAGANLLAGISAAIAAIPEEPPVVLGVILGLGAFRLLRRGVLVRRLYAQETLGAVDLILTDKTGTLTENRLSLIGIHAPGGRPPSGLSEEREILSDALHAEDDAWRALTGARPGVFTLALREALASRNVDAELDPATLVETIGPTAGRPFSSARLRRWDGELELAVGAPEAVLELSPSALAAPEVDRWRRLVARAAGQGTRLLLLSERRGEDGWRPRGLLAFADPLRPGVAEALGMAREAGIQIVIVTGDHPRTASTIAAQAGVDRGTNVTGEELAGWDDDRLIATLPELRVVARALPDQKLRLVAAARRAGRTVAVTGDGVNDAPALQHADVAVAFGSGTAVAKEASDLVLGDNSFSTLLYALREGRRMIDNVQKALVFLISTHVAMLGFILIATLAGFGQPLLPIQVLWLELFIDTATSIAYEREAEEPGSMRRPPRPRREPLLGVPLLGNLSLAGGFTAVAALLVLLAAPGDFEERRWLAFTILVVGQVFRAYANRSLVVPLTRLGTNRLLAAMVGVALLAQIAIPYLPGVAEAFRAAPLDLTQWLLVAAIAAAPVLAAEILRDAGARWAA